MELIVIAPLFFVAGFVLGRYLKTSAGEETLHASTGGDASPEVQFGHLREVLAELHGVQGLAVDTLTMDGLLGIDNLQNEETKRSRRARLVSDVNSWGWAEYNRPIVVRERDETDRRRTLFEVAAFELPSWM